MAERQAVLATIRSAALAPLFLAALGAQAAAQRHTATLVATATVVADPLTIRTAAPVRVALGAEAAPRLTADSGPGTWQLRAPVGSAVLVAFDLPATLTDVYRPAVTVPVDFGRSAARWRTSDAAPRRFAPRAGTVATFGADAGMGLSLDLVGTPAPAAPRSVYEGTVVLELTYL
jgi:hypothetical protein